MLKPPRENSIDEVLGRVWAKVLSVARECLFGACVKALQVQNSVKKEHSTRLQEKHQPFLRHMQKTWQTRLDFFSLLEKS